MASANTLELFVIFLCISRIIANSDFKNKCEYDLIKSSSKKSQNLIIDGELVYRLSNPQNGCMMNIDEIYKDIINVITVNRTQIYVSLGFSCESSKENSNIHFSDSDSDSDGKFEDLEISVQIILGACLINMDELTYFQRYGHIWSVITTNASYIHPGLSCSSLKSLRMLSSSLPCTEDNENNTKGYSKSFFWEVCDPFEHLFNLQIQGCETRHYEIKHSFIQTKFPKLQTLRLKYMNLSLSDLTFPWTNVYIDSSGMDIIKYLTYYKESETYENNTFSRSIKIYDSIVNFGSDITFIGYIDIIVINNVRIPKLDNIFMEVRGLEDLDLSSNEIQEVDRHVFRMQLKLMRLILANNRLITLPEKLFDNLHNLLYLDISSNRIIQLNQGDFKYLLKLKELNLQNNDIITLSNDFLASQISSIQYVYLSNNPLQNLPLNAFKAPNLILVDMRYCQINSSGLLLLLNNINLYEIQTGYSQSQSLQPFHKGTFDLTRNKITDIPIDLQDTTAMTKFKSVIQSFYINLKDNPFYCTCKILSTAILAEIYADQGLYIDWKCQNPPELRRRLIATIEPEETYCKTQIKTCPARCKCFKQYRTKPLVPDYERTFIIDCRNINMTSMPLVMPTGRLMLWFRNSSLIEITPRDYLKNVIDLDVSYNRINQITYDTAAALSKVLTLKLDHNNFTYLPVQLAKLNMTLVTLSNNPFICDCKMKWMYSWYHLQTNPVKDWLDIECTYKASRVGQMISLNDTMFVCKEHKENFRLHEHVIFPSIIIGSVLFVLVSITLLVIFNRFTIRVLLFLYFGVRPFDKQKQSCFYSVFLC